MLKLGIDAHVLSGIYQGSRTYIENLFASAITLNQDVHFYFMGHWENCERPFNGNNVTYLEYNTASRAKRILFDTAALCKKHEIDVFHAQYNLPFGTNTKTIVTIHDVLTETHPEYFPFNQRLRSRILYRSSARRASQIHTVSEYSKQQISACFKINPDSIYVIPNGVSPIFNETTETQSSYIDCYGKYVLTVGRLEPRKNHVQLIEAFSRLKAAGTDIGKLVIAGQKDFHFEQIFDLIKNRSLERDVVILENVSTAELVQLYRQAFIFAYPSYAEGFGIPPIEAMASGTPVITSNCTSLPEVVGDAAMLISPDSIEELYRALKTLSESPERRESLIAKGLERSTQWTWQSAATRYLDALTKLKLS